MTSQEFIFSNRPAIRLSRHLLFWLLFALHFTIQNLMIGGPGEAKTSRTFIESFSHLLYFLPLYLASTYFFLAVILPHTLYKKKYLLFTLCTLVLLALVITTCQWSGKLYIHTAWGVPYGDITFTQNKYHILVDGIFVPLMIWGIAGGFKVLKKWYEKQKENQLLARQKIATEIKLLKVQIHPRFLFHTLNSVQQQVHSLSNEAPAMVLRLSDLLSYLLYESDQDKVLLDKEIEIVQSYLKLQKADKKNKLSVSTEISGDPGNKTITPLILFAFAENYFEHFFDTVNLISHSLLKLEVNENKLHAVLEINFENRSQAFTLTEERLQLMKQQLQDLYPEQNKIKTSNTANGALIEWVISLGYITSNEQANTILNANEEKLAI